ncbi:copper transporter [Nocardioides sp. GY 10127]|nr:copper transporter [Nocardioides sp. GY 10127]
MAPARRHGRRAPRPRRGRLHHAHGRGLERRVAVVGRHGLGLAGRRLGRGVVLGRLPDRLTPARPGRRPPAPPQHTPTSSTPEGSTPVITYRHHVVSLVAVFLALAVGVVLGGGPLSEPADDAGSSSATSTAASERDEAAATYADTMAEASEARLLGNRLDGSTVAIVTTPGVDEDTVSALTSEISDRGGSVTARYDLLDTLVGGSSTSLVDTLGTQLVTQLDAGTVDKNASSYVRIGQLLGLAIATTSAQGTAADTDTRTIRASLSGADLATSSKASAARAGLVLVVLGDDTDADVLAAIVSGVSAMAGGVVVAGSTASATDGTLAGLRESSVADAVPTVDSVQRTAGQVTALLALTTASGGQGGDYGPVAGTAVPLD